MTITKDRVTIMWKKPVKHQKSTLRKKITKSAVQEVCIVNLPLPTTAQGVSVNQARLGSKKKKDNQ